MRNKISFVLTCVVITLTSCSSYANPIKKSFIGIDKLKTDIGYITKVHILTHDKLETIVEVEGDKELLAITKIEKRGGNLIIEHREHKHIKPHKKAKFLIRMPANIELDAKIKGESEWYINRYTGKASFSIEGDHNLLIDEANSHGMSFSVQGRNTVKIKSGLVEKFKVKTFGNSDIYVRDIGDLSIKIFGRGTITAAGTVNDLKSEISGQADININKLMGRVLKQEVSGVANFNIGN
jgi:hypothetical protein